MLAMLAMLTMLTMSRFLSLMLLLQPRKSLLWRLAAVRMQEATLSQKQ
jgi:hypothetical protein